MTVQELTAKEALQLSEESLKEYLGSAEYMEFRVKVFDAIRVAASKASRAVDLYEVSKDARGHGIDAIVKELRSLGYTVEYCNSYIVCWDEKKLREPVKPSKRSLWGDFL